MLLQVVPSNDLVLRTEVTVRIIASRRDFHEQSKPVPQARLEGLCITTWFYTIS